MTTVAVGSLWRRKGVPSTAIKVIHTFDYAQIDHAKERYIIFEKIYRSPVEGYPEITLGVFVESKSDFLVKMERPPLETESDTP